MNLPNNSDKVKIIEELKKDLFKSLNDKEDQDQDNTEDDLLQEEMYEYLIDKVSLPHSRAHGRDLRNSNFGILGSINGHRGIYNSLGNNSGDLRIRVNASNINRFRSVLGRNHF